MTAKKKIKNILLIDNNLSFADKIKNSIELLGYEITVSNSPELAIEAFRKGNFNLVIADSTLPRVPSREVIEKLKKHDKSVPVFIVSEDSSPDIREESMLSGASDFFLKQFEFDRLLMKIYKLK